MIATDRIWPSPEDAERVLDGLPGLSGLHRLIAAAAGPGRPEELAGEAAAVAEFRAGAAGRRAPRG
jgi:hypothetical protein